MKFKNIKNLVFLVTTVAVTGISCKKQDFNNTNPDSVTGTTVDYRTVLPPSMNATATIIEGSSFKFLQNWMGYWARSGSYQDITDEETYVFDNDFNVAVWNNLYSNATNYNFVIQKSQLDGAGFYEAIGRIMKSLDFQMLVDVYGNVPYSQAFQGVEGRTPSYDKGQDIYDSLFIDIDRAIALLKDPIASGPDNNKNIAINDLIWGGNATQWIKFANTLKLRMIMHAFQAPGFDVAGKVATIEAEGSGYLGSGETAKLNPGFSSSKPTPYWRANILTEAGAATSNGAIERANAYAVGPYPPSSLGYYNGDGDPRIDGFYNPPLAGTPPVAQPQRGIIYGELAGVNSGNTGDKLSTTDGPGIVPNGAATDAWILTDFESLFVQAEAKERNITTAGPSAADLLHAGMSASFNRMGLDGSITISFPVDPTATGVSDLDNYLIFDAGYPDVDYDDGTLGTGTDPIYTILSQKWFALNSFDVLEIWTDWRRTDIVYGQAAGFLPGPPVSTNPARPAGRGIPIRLFYPQNEYNYNAASVAAQGTIDVTSAATPATGRIFWDIN